MSHDWLASRAEELTGRRFATPPVVVADTTDFMAIERDMVVDLAGELFLVTGNERERRFGLEDAPKFWVKRAFVLDSGRRAILKMVFAERFRARVGRLEVVCARNAEKEAAVLDLVRGDERFMQGRSVRDLRGNLVRILDVIEGVDMLSWLDALDLPHADYVATRLRGVLVRLTECLRGLERLHEAGLCHGDIRNDHILVEAGTGRFRWIDFDLDEQTTEFDVWSVGNILHCVAARGFVTFGEVLRDRPTLRGTFDDGDASVFFPYRVMNLRKVYPYLPEPLGRALRRFSGGGEPYLRVGEIVADLEDAIATLA